MHVHYEHHILKQNSNSAKQDNIYVNREGMDVLLRL